LNSIEAVRSVTVDLGHGRMVTVGVVIVILLGIEAVSSIQLFSVVILVRIHLLIIIHYLISNVIIIIIFFVLLILLE
jgi:hypothetical protein